MYSRVKKYDRRRRGIKLGTLAVFAAFLSIGSTTSVNTASMLTLSEIEEENKIEIQPISVDLSVAEPVSETLTQEEITPVVLEDETQVSQPVYQEPVVTSQQVNGTYPTVLANGNTAGVVGSEAAAQMAAATGVSQATWEYIIARESNGNPNAANVSGASGLFQTMSGWGSTATVQDQINSAINAYNNQGLAAWGM